MVDDNTNHRGARTVFLIMNSIGILEGVKLLMMTMTNFVERLHEDAIARRRHQAKGMVNQKTIITIDKMPSQNSELSLKTNNMMAKVQCKLTTLSGLCPEDEGHR